MEKKANEVISLQMDGVRMRASLNLGLVFTRFILAGLSYLILMEWLPLSTSYLYWLVMLLTAWLVFFIEWIVERSVARNPEALALRLIGPARFILISSLWLTFLPLRIRGEARKPVDATGMVTEDDLKTLVDAGQEEGLLEKEEGRMIISIVHLGETLAREVMVPRIDMVALEVNTPPEQAVEVMLQYGHSRVPVYEETIDQILGVLYVKDVLRAYRAGFSSETLRSILRPAYYIPEAKHLDSLLAEMQAQRNHMAIVVDEYGGVAGLVTLEDIVEEIVGEIQDEYDQEEESPYQFLENGDMLFQGKIDLGSFNEVMGTQIDTAEADTLGGLIYSRLGRVPSAGEKVQTEDLVLTVEQVSSRRIRKVRATRILPDSTLQRDAAVSEGNMKDEKEPNVIRSLRLSDDDQFDQTEETNVVN
jgi:CBS domain containing-hemolysin-like protein